MAINGDMYSKAIDSKLRVMKYKDIIRKAGKLKIEE